MNTTTITTTTTTKLLLLLYTPTGQEVAGKVSLKHIYEIAELKSKDACWETKSLEEICRSIIGTAHSCGIQVRYTAN